MFPLTPQRTVHLFKNWRDVLLELRLRAGKGYRPAAPLSFPLDRQRLEGAHIEWPARYAYWATIHWISSLKLGFAAHLPVRSVNVPVESSGMEPVPVTFQLVLGGKSYPVTIDYGDYMDQIFEDRLETSLVYFKMQYRRTGYAEVTRQHAKILPGGYVNGHRYLHKYLPYMRAYGARTGFTTDVYGRFGLTFAREIREKAHQLLSEQKHFRYRGGLVKRRYIHFLRECTEAKICIDLPSNSDFCYRLPDYLALGCCVVAPQHRTRMHVDLEDRKNIIYVARDLSDLVEVCRYYLAHDEERSAIGRAASLYFDQYLYHEQLAAYYLHECLAAAAEGRQEDRQPRILTRG